MTWRRSYMVPFDVDVALADAACDPALRPTQRMIANATIGIGLDDAYFSTQELRETLTLIDEDAPDGRRRLVDLLRNEGDDYQRCLYYCLAGCGSTQALADLA